MTAGKIDLNSASEEVLKGLISGTHTDPFYQESIKNVDSFCNALKKSDFIFKTRADLTKAVDLFYPLSSDLDHSIKHRREAIVRGLADSSQTRTWNLMVDLVSELGVEGSEKNAFLRQRVQRHWVHLAMDRLTGKLIDFQIEEVF